MIRFLLLKEMKEQFRSPMLCAVLGVISLVNGWMFFNLFSSFVQNTQQLPTSKRAAMDFYSQVFFQYLGNVNIIFLVIVPILGAGIIAKDRSSGGLIKIYQSQVTYWEYILSKYSLLLLISVTICTLMGSVGVLFAYSSVADLSFFVSGLSISFLNLCAYFAICLVVSSFCESTAVATILSFCLIVSLWMVSWILNLIDNFFLVQNIEHFSLLVHFENTSKGEWSIATIVYFCSIIFLSLFLSKKRLELERN